jgi:hypothetical protein
VTKITERIEVFCSTKDDIATTATIPSSGSSFWDVFFSAPCDEAIATFSGYKMQNNFIDK